MSEKLMSQQTDHFFNGCSRRQFGTLIKPGTSTTWNKCSAGLPASSTEIIQNEPQDVSPTWSRVLGGSLYSIDSTQTDSLCYSKSSMVWLTSLPTTFNPTTPVREVPNACGSYKLLKTSTSTFTVFPCAIIDWNRLPTIVTDVQTLQEFREGLSSLPPQLLQPY